MAFMLILMLCMGGCGKKEFLQPEIYRDVYNTGGNLSFDYDNITKAAVFGGKNEVVQYYDKDLARGWDKEGNRIGIQIIVPKNVKDVSSGSAELNGKEYLSKDYIKKINDTYYALFQPLVNGDKMDINLKITWQEGCKEQQYFIKIKEGTLFMSKQTENV